LSRFDDLYRETPDFFGAEPSRLVARFHDFIRRGSFVLDIGVGQGRNALFLARKGVSVEGVDVSAVGLEDTQRAAEAEGLPIGLHRVDIIEFSPHVMSAGRGRAYDAVLALGIVPVLSRENVDILFRRIDSWTRPGGLVFVSAWSSLDARFSEYESDPDWERSGPASFRRRDGVRTFLRPNEILSLLPGYQIVHHHEGPCPDHRHGEGPPEQHEMADLLARKPSGS
jgi:SAM-dependent methyltransferase